MKIETKTHISFLILLFITLCFFKPIIVSGNSMFPTLKNNQFCIISTTSSIKENDIVVTKNLDCFFNNSVIKRVLYIDNDKVWLQGDNTENSYDSRNVGWIDKKDIIGVVIQ